VPLVFGESLGLAKVTSPRWSMRIFCWPGLITILQAVGLLRVLAANSMSLRASAHLIRQ
jgi:hypothetical protein